MAVKPKFYPVLPYEPRQKRLGKDSSSGKSHDVTFRRYQTADSVSKINGLRGTFVYSDDLVTVGTNSKSLVRNADWRQKIAKGINVTSSYSREIHRIRPTRYTVTSENSLQKAIGRGNECGGLNVLIRDNSVLKDQAVARLKNKLNGFVGQAQLAAPLAESREIHRLVKQVNGLTMDMLRAALAIKKTKGRSAAKFFGDVWLGFNFGVNPMIKDIASAANAILDFQTREDREVRVVGTASQEYHSATKIPVLSAIAPGVTMGYFDSNEHMQGVQIVAGIDLKVKSDASYGMDDQLGLTLGDVPGVIWELTPFSWVVDYAITVGPWLDDMFFTLPGVTKYISQAEKYQLRATSTPVVKYASGYTGSFSGSASVYEYVSFTRTPLSSLPSRQLRVKTVDEVAKYSLSKVLNLASVLAQKRAPKL